MTNYGKRASIREGSLIGAVVLVVISTFLSGCASSFSRTPIRYVVSQVARSCEDLSHDENLADPIEEQRRSLRNGLPDSIEASTRDELLDAVAADDPRPITIFYSGHGTDHRTTPDGSASDRSAMCFSDGELRTDELLAAIHPRAQSAMLVLDACYSARVDVRRSRVPVAVLSAADKPIATTSTGTGVGHLIPQALAGGDANDDGIVDDDELVRSLIRHGGPRLAFEPRLRRQAFSAIPVVATRTGPPKHFETGAIAGHIKSDLLNRERDFTGFQIQSIARTPSVFWVDPTGALGLPKMTARSLEGPLEDLRAFARRLTSTEGFVVEPRGLEVSVLSLRSDTERAAVPVGELAALIRRIESGEWGTFNATQDALWTSGYLADVIGTTNGIQLQGDDVCALKCGEPLGQCFGIASRGACR